MGSVRSDPHEVTPRSLESDGLDTGCLLVVALFGIGFSVGSRALLAVDGFVFRLHCVAFCMPPKIASP